VTGKTLLRARWIAPMDREIIPDGAVAFADGWIIDLGRAEELRQRHPDATVEDAGEAVVLPGLVNAHTHLELTNVTRPEGPPPSFVDWLLQLMFRLQHVASENATGFVQRGVRDGASQCLRFGVTTVGDVTRNASLSRPPLASSGLRAVSFGEVVGMATRRDALPALLAAAREPGQASTRLAIGLEPHSPYSLDLAGYLECVQTARRDDLPITTHLAETPHEAEFLSRHQGELRRLWDALDAWSDDVTRFDGGPVRAMHSVGLLDLPALLAHVNYCDDDELAILAQSRASVVYCPRTHAYFAHPPHRWRDMLARGINVAVGTDSCASSPDLNLVDDLRLLHGIAPDVSPRELWAMATTRGARALGQSRHAGSISPDKDADLAAFPATSDDPLAEVLETSTLPTQVWVAGQRRT
jgi:cytosine/adenosine deaminase-related metal-dependent hydrolase